MGIASRTDQILVEEAYPIPPAETWLLKFILWLKLECCVVYYSWPYHKQIYQQILFNYVHRTYLSHLKLHCINSLSDPLCKLCQIKVSGMFLQLNKWVVLAALARDKKRVSLVKTASVLLHLIMDSHLFRCQLYGALKSLK